MPFIGFDWRYRRLGIDQNKRICLGKEMRKTPADSLV
jgi:hypothetical protein